MQKIIIVETEVITTTKMVYVDAPTEQDAVDKIVAMDKTDVENSEGYTEDIMESFSSVIYNSRLTPLYVL